VFVLAAPAGADPDSDALTALLQEFLAHAGEAAAHERFWAEELVYTSSAGERFGKAEILRGFDDPATGDAPPVVYSAEDIRITQYGDTAVVAFRLVATPAAGDNAEPGVKHYFNTGTFVKRNGAWRAVAWQATRIPEPGESGAAPEH